MMDDMTMEIINSIYIIYFYYLNKIIYDKC